MTTQVLSRPFMALRYPIHMGFAKFAHPSASVIVRDGVDVVVVEPALPQQGDWGCKDKA